jgi:E3 ubiquitin-protein ligase DOA10
MSTTRDPVALLEMLDWQVQASQRHIVATIIMGILAGCLVVFGEHSLERARPLFSVIDQNYGLWQNGFGAVTILIAFVWVVAMMQKISLYQDCLRKQQIQRRIVEQHRIKEQAAEERRRQREQERAEREALANEPLLAGSAARKQGRDRFDY